MKRFSGSIVALVTPFSNGKVNFERFEDLCRWHFENGTSGIVVAGTTGESPTLSEDEYIVLVRSAHKAVGKKIPIIAGAGGNNTREAIHKGKIAKENGADALLSVVPYYSKPTQEGLYRHFEAIAKATSLPVILYNVPGRTAAALTVETLLRLSATKNIVAVKEATTNMELVAQVVKQAQLDVLSGEDSATVPMMAIGAVGVISVAANVIPHEISEMCAAALKGDFRTAREIHLKCIDLFKYLFVESNPIPVKYALKLMGKDSGELRLPMCEISAANGQIVEEKLRAFGLVDGRNKVKAPK